MEAFLVSTGIVALAEMGDKTQLLALILAARFQRPLPIILGILVATLLNHAAAGAVDFLALLVQQHRLYAEERPSRRTGLEVCGTG